MRQFVRSLRPKSKTKTLTEPPAPRAKVASTRPHGLHVIAEGIDPIVDIVAVHGLNGHPERTWTASNGVNWLRNLLPQDLPNARILAWGYDANTHSTTGVSCQYLYDHALELVSSLCLKRELTQTSKRPIIFIAHSLGGIVVKSALIHSDAARQGALAAHRSIKVSTYGILFMGTPHQGGNGVALGTLLVNIASVFVPADNRLLQHLERDSEWLQQQLRQYGPINSEFVTKFAYEVYETPTALGRSLMVVPRASAVVSGAADAEPIAIHADHKNMVKFESRLDRGYETVSGHVQLMAASAGDAIARCWEMESRVNAARLNEISVPVCHVIPFPQNRKFVGRGEQLLALQQKLFIQRDSQRIALVGLGGVGKTQLALQFAYWTKEHQPEYSIFWIPALSAESFDQACGELVRRLAIPKAVDDEDPKESVRRYLSLERAGKWLLIVDNADDIDMLDRLLSDYSGISEFFPAHEDRLVLFTTRHEETAWSLASSNTIPLLEMNRQEACTLFEKSLTRRDGLGDDAIMMTLLEELTFHPLAITQAAAYLNMTRASISKYIQLIREGEADLVDLMSREFRDSTRYRGARNAVATAWLVSFDQIRAANPHAADLLCFISQIEPRAIPLSLLPSLQSEEQQVFALGTLHSYAFVTRRGDSDVYDMHRLVHLATRIWIRQNERTIEISEQATRHLAEIFPSSNYMNQTIWREYLPHAVRLLQDRETIAMEERYDLCMKMGNCLNTDGRVSESVRWLLEAYQWAKKCLPEEHPSRLASQHTLAGAYEAYGQVKKAVELLEHIVAIEGKTLAEEHPSRLASQHALARAYEADGQVKKAVKLLEHVVTVREKTLAEEHPSRLTSQHALAIAYEADGQVKKAVELLEYIIAIDEKMLAEEHPSRLASQQALAGAYEADGQVKKAVKLLEHVVATKDRTMREGHPSRVVSHDLLTSMSKLKFRK